MLESQTPLTTGSREPDEPERAVNFQFTVTWSFLFSLPSTPKPTNAIVPLGKQLPGRADPQVSEERNIVQSLKTSVYPAAPQWEMAVPKMLRSDSPPTAAEAEVPEPAGPALNSSPPFYSRPSAVPKLFLAAAVLVAIAVPVWRNTHPTQPKPKSANQEMDPRGGGWIREAASGADAGSSLARALNLYQPSLNARDGQFEFAWTVDTQGAGWVFRAKDLANYYAVRIKALSQTPSLRMSVEHFTVYLGSEGSHSEKVLDLPRTSALRIKMDAAGPSFTLYLDGNAVDYWTDARLTSGGFGFLEEQHLAPVVRSVRMSFPERSQIERERTLREMGALFAMDRLYRSLGKFAPASGGA